jgi:NADH:ubiquinone oxidoreductase subunit C
VGEWLFRLISYFNIFKNFFSYIDLVITKSTLKFSYISLQILNKFFVYNLLLILKNNSIFKLNALLDLICVDNIMQNGFRFMLIYSFWIYNLSSKIILKTFTNEYSFILSLNSIFKSSNWSEREIFDLFGLIFGLHEDMRKILTDYGFKGYPLRKDFPLTGFLEVQYDLIKFAVYQIPLESTQGFRNFFFENPWIIWKN